MSKDFYTSMILPYAAIIIKICRAYTDSEEDFEDYYQEVCLQIWRSHQNFRSDAKWSSYVYRIALNVCLTLLKKKNPTKRAMSLTDSEIEPVANDAFQDERIKVLYDGLKKLKEADRALILLYLEGHKYDEIASIVGSNANNIGVRISRIKEKLKIIIGNEYY